MASALQGTRGVIFELDSVLFDKSDWVLPATEFAAQQMRLEPGRAVQAAKDYIAQHGGADPQIYNDILVGCGQFDTAMNVRAFAALINQYQPPAKSLKLFPGVEEALRAMREHLRMVIVTDGPTETQRNKVNALGLNEIVGAAVYSDEIEGIRSRLPDPRPLLQASKMMGLQPAEVAFVGHNPLKHFMRTREQGFTTVRVMNGEYCRQPYPSDDHKADLDLDSAADLLDVFIANGTIERGAPTLGLGPTPAES